MARGTRPASVTTLGPWLLRLQICAACICGILPPLARCHLRRVPPWKNLGRSYPGTITIYPSSRHLEIYPILYSYHVHHQMSTSMPEANWPLLSMHRSDHTKAHAPRTRGGFAVAGGCTTQYIPPRSLLTRLSTHFAQRSAHLRRTTAA